MLPGGSTSSWRICNPSPPPLLFVMSALVFCLDCGEGWVIVTNTAHTDTAPPCGIALRVTWVRLRAIWYAPMLWKWIRRSKCSLAKCYRYGILGLLLFSDFEAPKPFFLPRRMFLNLFQSTYPLVWGRNLLYPFLVETFYVKLRVV
jgi:hypothetical protein